MTLPWRSLASSGATLAFGAVTALLVSELVAPRSPGPPALGECRDSIEYLGRGARVECDPQARGFLRLHDGDRFFECHCRVLKDDAAWRPDASVEELPGGEP